MSSCRGRNLWKCDLNDKTIQKLIISLIVLIAKVLEDQSTCTLWTLFVKVYQGQPWLLWVMSVQCIVSRRNSWRIRLWYDSFNSLHTYNDDCVFSKNIGEKIKYGSQPWFSKFVILKWIRSNLLQSRYIQNGIEINLTKKK